MLQEYLSTNSDLLTTAERDCCSIDTVTNGTMAARPAITGLRALRAYCDALTSR